MEDLLREILQAVRRRGWSARQASMKAVGTPELIRDMRRGRVPSVERFRALCEVLGLEFYVGPPRSESPLKPERLQQAIRLAEDMSERSPNGLTHAEKARVASSAYVLMSGRIEDGSKAGEQISDGLLPDAQSSQRSISSTSPIFLAFLEFLEFLESREAKEAKKARKARKARKAQRARKSLRSVALQERQNPSTPVITVTPVIPGAPEPWSPEYSQLHGKLRVSRDHGDS